jgi:tetratricopeptide (TPR) repeat protein
MRVLLFVFVLQNTLLFSQNEIIDSLENRLASVTTDSSRILILCELCGKYRKTGDVERSLEKGTKGLTLAEKTKFAYGYAKCALSVAISLKKKSDFKSALGKLQTSRQIFEHLLQRGDTIKFPEISSDYNYVLMQLGIVYKSVADYPHSLEYYFKVLKIHERTGNADGMATAYNNIGEVYNNLGDKYSALQYQLKDLRLQEESGDKGAIANAYSNIALLYFEMHDTAAQRLGVKGNEKFIISYRENLKALKLREELKDSFGIALSYGNMGMLYPDLDENACRVLGINYSSRLLLALDCEFKSKAILERQGNAPGVSTALVNIANLYFALGKNSDAITNAKQAEEIALATGDVETEKTAHYTLYSVFKKLKKSPEALAHYEKYILLRDSIYKEENRQDAMRRQLNHEFSQKEFVLQTKQEKEKAILAADKKRQKQITYAVSAGLAFVLIISLFLFKSLNDNKQKNRIISRQKQVVDEKQKELIDSIKYARRIQQALLTPEKYINRKLKQLREK